MVKPDVSVSVDLKMNMSYGDAIKARICGLSKYLKKSLEQREFSLCDVHTSDLVAELQFREGVNLVEVPPHANFNVNVDEPTKSHRGDCGTGAAKILVVID